MPSEPPSKVADGEVVLEKLPLPVVHYPCQYGTFLAFSQTLRSSAAMCLCARPAVENLLRLRPSMPFEQGLTDGPEAYFPAVIARRIVARNGANALPISFVPGLCHQCCASQPRLIYCDETQGTPLMQVYGWYVNQAYLRLGILPHRHTYLPEVCPPGFQAKIEIAKRLESEFSTECDRLLESFLSGSPPSAPLKSLAPTGLRQEEVGRLVELRQSASHARRDLKMKVEDFTNQQLLYPI